MITSNSTSHTILKSLKQKALTNKKILKQSEINLKAITSEELMEILNMSDIKSRGELARFKQELRNEIEI